MLMISHLVVSGFFVTPWTAAHQASLFFIISQNLLKFMFIESVMPSSSPHAFNVSHHEHLFQRVRSSHEVAKVLELHH